MTEIEKKVKISLCRDRGLPIPEYCLNKPQEIDSTPILGQEVDESVQEEEVVEEEVQEEETEGDSEPQEIDRSPVLGDSTSGDSVPTEEELIRISQQERERQQGDSSPQEGDSVPDSQGDTE